MFNGIIDYTINIINNKVFIVNDVFRYIYIDGQKANCRNPHFRRKWIKTKLTT
jgi:hypothetical protein